MNSLRQSAQVRKESATSSVPVVALALVILLLAGCGDNPPPTATATISASNSQNASTIEPTQSSSSDTAEQNTPSGPAAPPAIAADGTLKTAMQRIVEARGMRFSLTYTSTLGATLGTPDQDYAFNITGVTSGRLLPNRKSEFTLTMTGGTKGKKQNGEWILYWVDTDIKSFFKNGTQWESVNASELKEDKTNFDPIYAYNELGELTTFGPTSLTGDANPEFIGQIAALYTLSGTEQLNGEAVDRYHRVGDAGGVLDLWVSKSTGDIVRFLRDISSNGIGTIADLYLSDIDKPQVIPEPK